MELSKKSCLKKKFFRSTLKLLAETLSYLLDQLQETIRFSISHFKFLLLMMISTVYTRINYPVENLSNHQLIFSKLSISPQERMPKRLTNFQN